jgi:hypothetical protein
MLIIHTDTALDIFRKMFLHAYRLERPIVQLGDVIYWEAQMQMLRERFGSAAAAPGAYRMLIAVGAFYNFSSPVPDGALLAQACRDAADAGVEHVLIPTVAREPDESAVAAGFRGVPCFVESWTDPGTLGVEEHLIQELGRRRYRDLRRLARKAGACFDWQVLDAAAVMENPGICRQISELHAMNLQQHGLSLNFYDTPILEMLLSSPLAPLVRIVLRHDRQTGRLVQMILTLEDRDEGDVFVMAQGIDHDHVPREQNLYRSLSFELMTRGAHDGVRRIFFGRGSPAAKRRLGANRFRLLYHWIYGPDPENALQSVADRTAQLVHEQLEGCELCCDAVPERQPC